ncbi:MAG: flagellar biosynthetic protein FliR [Bacillota bacterium]
MVFLNYGIVFLLVLVRMIFMFVLTPIFNNESLPMIGKIGFVFFTTYIMMPYVFTISNLNIVNFLDFIYFISIEVLNGLLLGFVVDLSFGFVYIAGLLVDRNIGFAMVSVVNPQSEAQIPVTANMYFLFLMLMFFTVNIHHRLIEALYKSYEVLPIGKLLFNFKTVDFLFRIIGNVFVVGVQIAAPFILTILITNLILGLLSKAMPGMNVFLVGLPLKVFVGLITFLIVIQYYFDIFNIHLNKMVKYVYQLLEL